MNFLDGMDRSVAPLARGLETRAWRQAAISANIANADTPGYRAVDVSFAALLEAASPRLPLMVTDSRHFRVPSEKGQDSLILSGGSPRRDGNDVDVDREMAKLARNQIEYQFLTRALGGRFRKLKEAITGRAAA